jgi:hypothetical protein
MIGENGYGGTGRLPWKIDSTGHLSTRSVTETEPLEAVELGYAWNLNTKNVSLSGSTAMLYLKNNNADPFIIQTIVIGTGDAAGGTSDIGELTLYNNPTTGTIIDDANGISVAINRRVGNSIDPTTNMLIYAPSASGKTITDGTESAFFYHGNAAAGRSGFPIDWELPQGTSVGLVYDPKLSSGTVKCYVAVIGFLKTRGF